MNQTPKTPFSQVTDELRVTKEI
jgi:hypothetical protein